MLSVIMNQGRLILLGSEASSRQNCVTEADAIVTAVFCCCFGFVLYTVCRVADCFIG